MSPIKLKPGEVWVLLSVLKLGGFGVVWGGGVRFGVMQPQFGLVLHPFNPRGGFGRDGKWGFAPKVGGKRQNDAISIVFQLLAGLGEMLWAGMLLR